MKDENKNIDAIERRTKRYWYDDGLTEIAAGCIFLLVALLFIVEAFAPRGALPAGFWAFGLPVLIIVSTWLAGRIVAALKDRFTYPRTGYVAYHRPGPASRVVTVLVAFVVAALLSILFRSWTSLDQWTPALEGLAIAVFLLYLAHTLGLARFHLLALFSAIAGSSVAAAGLGEKLGTAAYFSAMGIALVASGGLTLRRYLNKTRSTKADRNG